MARKFFTGIQFSDGTIQTSAAAALYGRQAIFWKPSGVAAGLWFGTAGQSSGTHSKPTLVASGNIYQGISRSLYASTATQNLFVGQRSSELIWSIGNVAGKGGFMFASRSGFDVWTNGGRAFFGLSAGTNNVVTGDPSATDNTLGFAVEAADNGLIYFLSRNTGSTTKVSTGLTITSNAAYDFRITCAPNGTSITWYIKDINAGTEATGSVSTNLPAATAFMTAAAVGSNATLITVGAVSIGVAEIYIESNY